MSEISKSDLGIIEERLPIVIDQFENLNHIGSGTFSKVYVANIKELFSPCFGSGKLILCLLKCIAS